MKNNLKGIGKDILRIDLIEKSKEYSKNKGSCMDKYLNRFLKYIYFEDNQPSRSSMETNNAMIPLNNK